MERHRTPRQLSLLRWVMERHGEQRRGYTDELYFYHCIRVGEAAEEAEVPMGWEIGLCHDLIEDTAVTPSSLRNELWLMGYKSVEKVVIATHVEYLTDVYTPEAYPNLNRTARKELEAQRLWGIPREAQTVKYCDMLDNSPSIIENDQGFARVYIKEKERILEGMVKGDPDLLNQLNLIIDKYHKGEI